MPASDSEDEFSNGEFDDSAFEESLSPNKKEVPLSNDRYDLALNVSASMDDVSAKLLYILLKQSGILCRWLFCSWHSLSQALQAQLSCWLIVV